MNILKMIKEHNEKEKVSFHMPGHKKVKGFMKPQIKSGLWELDTTELSDTDCLENPVDGIKRAEEKAAKAYGAEHSFFLVNGATSGILSMFKVAFKDGDKVIVSRDCHKSVINAMELSGVSPVFLNPLIHEKGFSGGVSVEDIRKAIENHSDAKGVFLTSPTYFGIVSDIEAIAKVAHENGMLLLCDEAHGAHFPFSECFPESAVSLGADMSVVSLHKSMPCPNQTAILNLGKCSVSAENVKAAVNMFQTTSPSYIFLSMIEQAIDIGKTKGEELTERFMRNVVKNEHIYSFSDPFKLILDFSSKGYTGYEVSSIFEKKFGIYAEMAIEACVLLMASWSNNKKDFAILKKAIEYVDSLPRKKPIDPKEMICSENVLAMTPREVFNAAKEKVPLNMSVGRIAAKEVTIFPPCIPVFMPGEVIKKEHIEKIENAMDLSLVTTGIEDGLILVIKK